ncbi:hypothetical protein Zmor_020586 [Zophobas morio]|uniref:Uncharacterized protein n=1 Tax=Zophobas morio TaxID=2755281 RepID=A0AA38I3W5_9CUCU|nr:hypothetical protein Zmor_020586 [Zophobas morio]
MSFHSIVTKRILAGRKSGRVPRAGVNSRSRAYAAGKENSFLESLREIILSVLFYFLFPRALTRPVKICVSGFRATPVRELVPEHRRSRPKAQLRCRESDRITLGRPDVLLFQRH